MGKGAIILETLVMSVGSATVLLLSTQRKVRLLKTSLVEI